MLKNSWIIAIASTFILAGCLNNDAERAVVGAGAGTIAADIFGTDRTGTAIVGAAAGVFCDDAGICS